MTNPQKVAKLLRIVYAIGTILWLGIILIGFIMGGGSEIFWAALVGFFGLVSSFFLTATTLKRATQILESRKK